MHGLTREGEYLSASEKVDSGEITIAEFRSLLSQLSGDAVDKINADFDTANKIDNEVVKIIASLKNKYRLALLSNSPSAYLRKILDDNDLAKYFDEVVVSSEVGLVKPDRRIFDLVISRLGVNLAEALFIDDNIYHVESAERTGIKSILFTSARRLKNDLQVLGIELS